jgi:hypothetical protein
VLAHSRVPEQVERAARDVTPGAKPVDELIERIRLLERLAPADRDAVDLVGVLGGDPREHLAHVESTLVVVPPRVDGDATRASDRAPLHPDSDAAPVPESGDGKVDATEL